MPGCFPHEHHHDGDLSVITQVTLLACSTRDLLSEPTKETK
jgi:hypothetical protein